MKTILSKEVLILVGLVGLHLFIFENGVGGRDGWNNFADTASLVEDFDFDISNNRIALPEDYDAAPDSPVEATGLVEGEAAKEPRPDTYRPPGASILDAPFYFVAGALADVASMDVAIPEVPYSSLPRKTRVQIVGIVAAHNLYTIIGVVLVFLAGVKLGFSRGVSFLASLFIFFGSPMVWYGANGLSHAASFLFMSIVLYLFICYIVGKQRGSVKREYLMLFVLGLLVGFASLVRNLNGPALIGLAACLLIFKSKADSWRELLLKEAALIGGGMLLAVVNVLFRRFNFGMAVSPQVEQFGFELLPGILFSARYGFFIFNPVFILGFIGLAWILIQFRKRDFLLVQATLFALLSFLAIAYFNNQFRDWSAPGNFSSRYLCSATVFLIPGLCEFLSWLRLRVPKYVLALLCVVFSYGLFILSRARLVYQDTPYAVGESLGDYARVFKGEIPVKEILSKIYASSYTIPFILRHSIVFILTFLVIFLIIMILVYVEKSYSS